MAVAADRYSRNLLGTNGLEGLPGPPGPLVVEKLDARRTESSREHAVHRHALTGNGVRGRLHPGHQRAAGGIRVDQLRYGLAHTRGEDRHHPTPAALPHTWQQSAGELDRGHREELERKRPEPSGVVWAGSAVGGPPALRITMSTTPYPSSACLATVSAADGSVASAATTMTSVPCRSRSSSAVRSRASLDRAQMHSRQPSAARRSAVARPRPDEAPPTSATLPRIPRSIAPSDRVPGPESMGISAGLGRDESPIPIHRGQAHSERDGVSLLAGGRPPRTVSSRARRRGSPGAPRTAAHGSGHQAAGDPSILDGLERAPTRPAHRAAGPGKASPVAGGSRARQSAAAGLASSGGPNRRVDSSLKGPLSRLQRLGYPSGHGRARHPSSARC